MRSLALALVATLLLSGCASNAPPSAAPAPASANATPVGDYRLANATVPKEELANATMGANHTHDLWGQAEEMVLLDATVKASQCEGAVDAVAYALQQAFSEQEVATGCAKLSLPEGNVVPEGTGDLAFEIDATAALKSGSMALQFRDKARENGTAATTEAKHLWRVPLTSADWDLPHAKATTWVMYVAARGPVGVLDGDVRARVVAHKMDGWKPVLAIAHVDHWKLPHLHAFAAPGVMALLDGEANVTNIDPMRFLGAAPTHVGVAFKDIVAPGAVQVVVVADTTKSDCAPVLQCWLVPVLHVGGYERDRFGKLLFESGARRVYAWDVPADVPEDSVYSNVSTTEMEPRIDACATGGAGGPTCGFASLASTSVTARVRVFAADHALSIDDVKALAP